VRLTVDIQERAAEREGTLARLVGVDGLHG
jgi:hypothetical protein